MLQILQSPMGAALIPQMNARENAIMDRSAADLQAVITRTASEADQNRRANEMQPYDIAQKKVTTAGVGLDNSHKQNVLDEYGLRGGAQGAATRADKDRADEQKKRDFEIYKKGLDTFRDAGSIVGMAPVGSKRQTAIDLFKRAQMPDSVISAIQNMPEERIDAEIQATIKRMNEAAPKFSIADLREQGQDRRTAATISGRLDVERIKQEGAYAVAQLRARATQMRAQAGTDPKAMNTAQRFADLSIRLESALRDGNMEEANFLLGLSRDLALTSKAKPEKPPAGPKTTTIRNRDGKVIMTETVEQGNGGSTPQTGTNNDGWGTPRMR